MSDQVPKICEEHGQTFKNNYHLEGDVIEVTWDCCVCYIQKIDPSRDPVKERNRNDGKVVTAHDEHIIFSKKCPNDPVEYDLNWAICTKDGSIWYRIGKCPVE